ncbi:uncharacterized protein LOC119402492 [Rhipicephalus sanguineus]|uniref:Uncharacterized protein n=1 Tax=Rhipicephalus sanguineus TaxID=34632 RepID=A0A9D4PIJ1_RHISA|nr:uncharacterized protein LOC119402492 [Rhipicephalus sanguineus]KAH7940070.1 hypothetical protein HPB52_020796 [Rhipicephalus sanguineus]
MVSEIASTTVVALIALSLVVLYFVHPADDALAAEVLLGDGREDEGWLPPIFVDFTGKWDPPLHAPEAILETKRMGAHGIKLRLNITDTGSWVLLSDEEWSPAANLYGSLHYGVKIMLEVEEHDDLDAKLLAYLLRRWSDMPGRVLVVSSSPMFLFALGGNNKNIVKALAWRPCSVAYKDWECTMRRNEKLSWHLVALAADWLYAWCFEWGLLTRVSMASAVVVDASLVSSRFVRLWSDRGLRVVALASDDPGEQEYLRRVLRVPIVADYTSLPGCEWC